MKKIMSIVLTVLLLLALTACGGQKQEAQTLGGWTLTEDAALTQEAKDALEGALEGLVGVNYTPVALLGTQLVSGTNYCFLCEAAVVRPDAQPYYALVSVYQDLQGKAEIRSIVALDLGKIEESGTIEDSSGQPDRCRHQPCGALQGLVAVLCLRGHPGQDRSGQVGAAGYRRAFSACGGLIKASRPNASGPDPKTVLFHFLRNRTVFFWTFPPYPFII